MKVLDQTGTVRTLLPSNISNQLERRRFAVATDKDGTEIRNDDTVKESSGEQRQGRVLHIHRIYLFLQNRQQTENSGIFVVRNSNVVTVAAKGGRITTAGPDLSKMNPALQRNGANGGASSMPPPKMFGRDRLIGKTCTIRKGPYKGLLGIVKDTTDTEARVELHTKNKVINVNKDILGVKDPITGNSMDFSRFSGGRGGGAGNFGGRGGYAGATPSRVPNGWDEGSRTPAIPNGGKTPSWGGSGAYNSGGRTPGWKQNAGGRTPAPAGWNDGSRTVNPYTDGSRTSYGGATAYGGVSFFNLPIPSLQGHRLHDSPIAMLSRLVTNITANRPPPGTPAPAHHSTLPIPAPVHPQPGKPPHKHPPTAATTTLLHQASVPPRQAARNRMGAVCMEVHTARLVRRQRRRGRLRKRPGRRMEVCGRRGMGVRWRRRDMNSRS